MKTLTVILALFTTSLASANSSSLTYVCTSNASTLSNVFIDKIGRVTENNKVEWMFQLSVVQYNNETDKEETRMLSTAYSRVSIIEPGKASQTIFGDKSTATNGVLPGGVIVLKDKDDSIKVGLSDGVYSLNCVVKTQEDN